MLKELGNDYRTYFEEVKWSQIFAEVVNSMAGRHRYPVVVRGIRENEFLVCDSKQIQRGKAVTDRSCWADVDILW